MVGCHRASTVTYVLNTHVIPKQYRTVDPSEPNLTRPQSNATREFSFCEFFQDENPRVIIISQLNQHDTDNQLTMKTTILLFLAIAQSEAFVLPLKVPSFRSAVARLDSVSNEEAIAQLHDEYRQLQDLLLQDLDQHKMGDAEAVSEIMFEKAAEMTAFEKYQQEEKLDQAHEKLDHALGDLEQAQALYEEARGDSEWAEDEAAMVESLDAGYEDMERLRDLSVHHAAHHLEEDARDRVMEATFQELKAELDIEDATELLSILKQNELALKATIQEMRKEKGEALREKFETHEMPKHQDFVKSVRKILQTKLIDHDPTKGNVAF